MRHLAPKNIPYSVHNTEQCGKRNRHLDAGKSLVRICGERGGNEPRYPDTIGVRGQKGN